MLVVKLLHDVLVFKSVNEGCEHGVNFGVECHNFLVEFGAVNSVGGERKQLDCEGIIQCPILGYEGTFPCWVSNTLVRNGQAHV